MLVGIHLLAYLRRIPWLIASDWHRNDMPRSQTTPGSPWQYPSMVESHQNPLGLDRDRPPLWTVGAIVVRARGANNRRGWCSSEVATVAWLQLAEMPAADRLPGQMLQLADASTVRLEALTPARRFNVCTGQRASRIDELIPDGQTLSVRRILHLPFMRTI